MSINRVVLMGRLVSDPELKTTNTGVSVTSVRIAVDRTYVKAGEERQADFFDVVSWRSTAEFVCRNFSKGSLIAIDGQLQSRTYQAKDGSNRTVIEIVADSVSFTGEKKETQQGNIVPPQQTNRMQGNYVAQRAQAQPVQPPVQNQQGQTYQQEALSPEVFVTPNGDLPF